VPELDHSVNAIRLENQTQVDLDEAESFNLDLREELGKEVMLDMDKS